MIVIDTNVLIEIFDRKSQKGDEALNKIVETDENISITAIPPRNLIRPPKIR